MLISDSNKFIFIHISKTAGSSIRLALKPYAIENPSSRLSKILKNFDLPRNYQKFRFRLHANLKNAQNKVPEDVFATYKKVAFVRNPWDRMVSKYAYNVHGTSKTTRKRNDSFEEYVLERCTKKDDFQLDYLTNNQGEIDCDFIGRFENLSEDYQKLAKFLDIKLPALPVVNISKRKGTYQDYYTQETRDMVAKAYKKDIEAFGYNF